MMVENTKQGASHTEVNMSLPSKYKNGDDIHFDYGSLEQLPSVPQGSNGSNLSKKKKSKKKKNKNKSNTGVANATINNPDDDYPTSRVIRQGPDGSVIVESLDNEDNNEGKDNENGDLSEDFQRHLGNPVVDMWFHNSTPEERKDLKEFWASLDNKQRVKLASVSKDELLSLVRLDPRQAAKGTTKEKQQDLHAYASQNCTCNHCGKKRNMVISEIERLYDQNIDAINDFIKSIRDLNQLPNLPSILFDGYKDANIGSRNLSINHNDHHFHHSHNNLHNHHSHGTTSSGSLQNASEISNINGTGNLGPVNNLPPGVNEEMIKHFGENFENMMKALNVEAFNKLSKDKQNLALNEINFVKQFLSENSGSAEGYQEFSKNFKFIQQMDKLLELNGKTSDIEFPLNKGVNSLTDDIFQNDGKGFIEMMESLSNSRNTREFFNNGKPNIDPVKDFHRQIRKDALEFKRNSQKHYGKLLNSQGQVHDHEYSAAVEINETDNNDVASIEELEDEYGSVYDESEGFDEEVELDAEYEDEEELEDEDEYDDDYNDESSNPDSEISEEEKLHELRHIFLMQVVRLFRQRLRTAYKDKLSQDRTQRLIEELEAEENAKKEKELKKLKQKEKAKEKKRLQQLAKEEEKKRKEEELKAIEEEKKKKEEQLKQEQRRRKEEIQRKKEEEKLKRIEEQQKKLAAQREKEEKERVRLAKLEEEKQKQLENLQKLKLEEDSKTIKDKSAGDSKNKEIKPQEEINEQYNSHSDKVFKESTADADSTSPVFSTVGDIAPTNKPSVASNISSNPLLQELYSIKPQSSTPKLEKQWFQSSSSMSPSPVPVQTQPQPFASSFSNLGSAIGAPFQDPFVDSFSNSQQSMPPGLTNISINPPISTLPPPGLTKNISSGHIPVAGGLQGNALNPSNLSSSNLNNLGNLNGISSNVWNNTSNSNTNTRSNSIWNSSGANNGSIWNGNSNSSTPNRKLLNINLGGVGNSDTIGVLNAAYQAFKVLSSTSSEYGMIKSFSLYQATQSMMPSNNLNFNQFLNSLSGGSDLVPFKFELVYDDFGTVNYIKLIESSNSPLTMQQTLNTNTPQLSQPLNDVTQVFNPLSGNMNGPSNVNNGINLNQPIMSLGANSFNTGKNLWN